jgi:hypothetical protein
MCDIKNDEKMFGGFVRFTDDLSGFSGYTWIDTGPIEPLKYHCVALPRTTLDRITKVELLGTQGNVVRCTFSDGDVQKAVCNREDQFDLATGIAVCVSKHALGGSSNYHRAIRQGLQVWKEQVKEAEEEIEKKIIAENHKRKHQRYLDRKKAKEEVRKLKEREQTIQDMAEAFKRAMGETNE